MKTAGADFSTGAFLERGTGLLELLMLGAMVYAAMCWRRRTGGAAPLVLGWGAAVGFVVSAVRFGATTFREGLRAMKEPQETPDLPVSYEAWALLGGLMEMAGGVALLVCGLALISIGWSAGARGTRRGRSPRQRRRR